MKRFLLHTAYVFLTSLVAVALWHIVFLRAFEFIESTESRLWLWGDSQIYKGIDPDKVNHSMPVYSVAQHGLGFQDLLMFSKRIPEESTALVGFGPLYYRYNQDKSVGGLSYESVESLFRAKFQYGLKLDLYGTLRRNISSEFSIDIWSPSTHKFYGNEFNPDKRDKFIKSLSKMPGETQFQRIFEFKDEYLFRSYDALQAKTKNWYVLSLPISDDLLGTDFDRIQHHYDSVLQSVSSRYQLPIDTLWIPKPENVFYDATHFTETTTSLVSPFVGKALTENTENRILLMRFRSSGSANFDTN